MAIRNCLRSEKTKEIFYTTEKSNCTEVVALFFHRCGLLEEALTYSNWIHDYRWNKYVPSYPTSLHDLGANSCYKKIKFVRCPYDRAVSCYFQYCRSPSINNYKPTATATSITKRLPKVIALDVRQKPPSDLSFYDFLRLMKTLYKTLNRQPDSGIPDPHITTQSLQAEQSHQIVWNHVIHVENMKNELAMIGIHNLSQLQSFENNLKKQHWNKTSTPVKHVPSLSKKPFHMITIKNVNYADFYDEECKSLVEQLYRIDFQCHPEYTWKEFLRRNQ